MLRGRRVLVHLERLGVFLNSRSNLLHMLFDKEGTVVKSEDAFEEEVDGCDELGGGQERASTHSNVFKQAVRHDKLLAFIMVFRHTVAPQL